MRGRVAAIGVALACLASGVHSTPATAVEGSATLAPGWWVGAYLTSATSSDSGTMTVHISRTGAATGSIDATGLAAAVGKRRATRLTFSGRLRVSGDASDMLAEGRIRARGRTKVMGLSVPVDVKVPGQASFRPTSATCSLASGDLSASARLPSQAAADYDTSVTARVVLKHVARRPSESDVRRVAEALSGDFLDAAAALREAGRGRATMPELRRALAAVEVLLAGAAGDTPCAAADTDLHRGFTDAVLDLVSAADLSNADLLDALRMSAQLGLLSNDFAGTNAPALRSVFEPALRKALERAPDGAAKARLQVAAVQYGFGDLL